ncbi:MAG: carboxyl transferase [Lachnospiraceae bacterium]|nr:carboxyl transferase [Lachnospiraceae bacterium]
MSSGNEGLATTRLTSLLDENSFVELSSGVTARSTDFNQDPREVPGDGVVTGYGLIDERLVFVYSQDPGVLGGTIGEMHARKIRDVYDKAMKMRAPIIGLIDCSGVRLTESFDSTESIGQILGASVDAAGVIPQITAVMGRCGGGMAVLNSLSDFSFMKKDAELFVNSPDAIEGNKEKTSSAEFQYEAGNVDMIGSEDEIMDGIRQLVGVLPSAGGEGGFMDEFSDDINRASVDLDSKRDKVADIAAELSDDHLFIETKGGFTGCMTTGFIQLMGTTVGVIGNEKDALCALGCAKAADFVRFLDAFDIPLLSLTNVNGYKASVFNEERLPRALAKMVSAIAEADIPKINLITNQAGSTAYLMMNSKAIGADLTYAFPDADVSVMDPALAGPIIAGDSGDASAAADEYAASQAGLDNALRRGLVDRVVDFADARKYLIAGFDMLFEKDMYIYKKHGTK